MTTKSIFAKHQIRIAKDTLKLSEFGARIMGGMDHDYARKILGFHGVSQKEIARLEGVDESS